ncbi:SWIM zinc finger family protein [Actinomadura violacea]|uniref:SWIM zinc finger family protein n=1 Tax=Actinomadura violacea TaxID=2819934 RepID=A0ABS3RXZ0_9ACTN|nr:SWIM zinc finger family protein [Actinomadura violacea]MBO2461623.1 SWIM zinc finger family protein [Actinomadura violacea]
MPAREPMSDLIIRPLQVEVQADKAGKNPHGSYVVTMPHCTCPDFQYRDKANDEEPHLCKHILAVHASMRGWRRVATAEEVAAAAEQQRAAAILASVPHRELTRLLAEAKANAVTANTASADIAAAGS